MSEVAALGFEKEIDADVAFLSATRRAQRRIFNERAVYSSIQIIPEEHAPAFYLKKLSHSPGGVHSFAIGKSAYSFRVSGSGGFRIGGREYSFSGNKTVFRGFADEGDELVFYGDFSYTVYDLSVYRGIYADKAEEIRLKGDPLVFDMNLLVGDFLAFGELPTDSRGKAIVGARFQGSRLYLPESFPGVAYVAYRKKPRELSIDAPDEELDLPVEAETLLPLLVASYMWLDDDREKAEYYLNAYREEMALIRRYISPAAGRGYDVPNGWA